MPLVCAAATGDMEWQAQEFRLTVNERGQVAGLHDKNRGVEYSAAGQASPLLQVRMDGAFRKPDRMEWDAAQKQLELHYGELRAVIQTRTKATHISLELVKLTPIDKVDRVQWGPIAIRIGQTVGEVIGVVRDDDFAIGLQVLNVKTLGGASLNDEGRDISRSQTAMPTEWGSTLQAYSIDRARPRKVTVWGNHYPNMPVPPIPGETALGSKIALFGCAASKVLERIGEIELAEGLPHPVIDGKWSRMNSDLGRSYLIAEFSEETVDEMLGYAKRGNFLSLYHSHPFKSWGHYELRPDHFPDGEAGMKECVRKAKALGIRIGVHTLTNFINTNDPYVTPVPDPRLAKTGGSTLVADIDAAQTEIEVTSPEYFNNTKANWMRTALIGQELVRYGRVSESAPRKLFGCRRGAFGTAASAHKKGDEIAKLMDHSYKVFLTSYEMQHEVAIRLAELFNRTGISHFDFDGHEGCWSSGQGDFGLEMFAKVFYDNVTHAVHNGTSNSQPYYWHINTCCNWGEPWYGGFRASMAGYRINNQAMLGRNFMPKMLGWFLLTPDTTLADIEWLMARSAGYNSGFAITTSRKSLGVNPRTGELLDTIRKWEDLRMADAFTEVQRERMRDTGNEFHLEKAGGGEYRFYGYHKPETYTYEETIRQPGEPTAAQWEYTNPGEKQPVQCTLEVRGDGGGVENIAMEFDDYIRFEIPLAVQHGQTLLCDGTKTLRLYDAKGRQAKRVELKAAPPEIPSGAHKVELSCNFSGTPAPRVQVQFKAQGKAEPVRLKR
jgi:hypothetical protein